MKNKLSNKLFKGLGKMLIINVMISVTGLICILVLKNTSNNIVVEYVELDAVQELRLSINQIIPPAYDYLRYHDQRDFIKFEFYLNKTFSNIEDCTIKLSNRHNKSLMTDIKKNLELFHRVLLEFAQHNPNRKVLESFTEELELIFHQINLNLQSILVETKAEIHNYTVVYKTSSKHSILAILGFSVLLLFIGYRWGLKFVQKINVPVKSLVKSTKIIADGNLKSRVEVKTGDELEELGNSFNKMITEIENLTVSRDYFDNIITSMFESLIVTNTNGEIITVNKATCELLSYHKTDLLKKNISNIINDPEANFKIQVPDLIKHGAKHDQEKEYISKTGEIIPIRFSCSVLNDRDHRFSGIIFIAHDLRESKKTEQKLDQVRKEHIIAINEAQEKERLRIASDIHDGLGQMLTGISYSIENNFTEIPTNNKKYQTHLIELQKLISDTIKESKIIAHDLIPILLKDFGLVIATQNLIEEIQTKHNIKINFEAYNFEKRLDPRLEKTLYRIIQEAINNIVKHAKASQSNIHLIKHKNTVSAVIEDNGVGFDVNAKNLKTKHKGIGLISMKERVSAFNGFINLTSEKDQGTEILIEIPINK